MKLSPKRKGLSGGVAEWRSLMLEDTELCFERGCNSAVRECFLAANLVIE